MAGFTTMKLKRKDLEEVNDDFSDFSLSSPARKIRRLDAELPPIMEEEEAALPSVLPAEHLPGDMAEVRNCPIIEELPAELENDERAIVLFKPMNTPLIQSPSSFSVLMDPHILSRIKGELWSSKSAAVKSAEDESANSSGITERNECLAVVPWSSFGTPSAPEKEFSAMMDAEDMGEASMDIEEENVGVSHGQAPAHSGSEGLHQWQQHCLIPSLPDSTGAEVVWFR